MDQKKAWISMGSTKYKLFPSLHLVMETGPVSEILCLKRKVVDSVQNNSHTSGNTTL